ncbi:hypothetical protein [Paludibacterium paludis]|uniref:Lipoprotein n=1 Tax=Paludibacterium paludis TaxID=1225769 RepID=A0A918U8G9_9NEIS|nr:hypothetical protein [Paludibacterium paludis]GGY09174.1 hypothetical protein GCM10011289_09870 [Paludibacterium paludis]
MKIAIATLTASAFLLTGCGSGGNNGSSSNTQQTTTRAGTPITEKQNPEGIWLGTTKNRKRAFALVGPVQASGHQPFHFAIDVGTHRYMPSIAGFLTSQIRTFSANDVKSPFSATRLALEGNITSGQFLTARLVVPGSSNDTPVEEYAFDYNPDYDRPLPVKALMGNYSDLARTLPGYGGYDHQSPLALTVDGHGILSGHVNGCAVTGTLFDLGKNQKRLFSLTLEATPYDSSTTCFSGKRGETRAVGLTGLATLTRFKGDNVDSLLFAATDATGERLLAGAVAKQ